MPTVKLPNGKKIRGVPADVTREELFDMAIRQGWATPQELGIESGEPPIRTNGATRQAPQQQRSRQNAQQPQQQGMQDFSATDMQIGAGENLLSMITGGVGDIAGGLSGLASAPFVGLNEAGEIVEKVSRGMTYEPRTRAGKQIQESTGRALQPVAEWMTQKPGDAAFELAQNPMFKAVAQQSGNPVLNAMANDPALAGAAGQSIVPLALEVLGVKGASKARTAAQARKAMADEIKNGNRNIENIINAVDQDGNLIKNPNVKKAVKMMGDDVKGKHAAINFEQLSNADRRQVNRMLDVIEQGRQKGTSYLMENRPADIIGEGLALRAKELNRQKRRANKMLNKVVNTDLKGKKVDVRDVGAGLNNALQKLGVKIRRKDGRVTTDFSEASAQTGSGLPKRELDKILNILDRGQISASEAHNMKRFVREFVDYDQGVQVGAKTSQPIESQLKSISTQLNDRLNEASDKYRKANQKYAAVADPLKKVSKQLKDIDLESEAASSKLGNLSKRIGSNLQSRDQVIAMVNEMDEALQSQGITPKTDIKRQVAALSDIEQIFKLEGQQAPFSFQGRIERAVTGQGMTQQALEAGLEKVLGMFEPEFKDKMQALRQLSKERKNQRAGDR